MCLPIGKKSVIFMTIFALYCLPAKVKCEIEKEPKLTLKWGTADGRVGFNKRTKASIDKGPSSFYVVSESDIYILDNVNNRVNRYLGGKWISSTKLFSSANPLDITVSNGDIYVLTNFSICLYDKSGKLIKIKKLTDQPSKIFHGVWRIFKLSNGFIVSTSKKGTILCLDNDMNYIGCNNWYELIKNYTVYDVVNDNFFVGVGDTILNIDINGKIISSTPDMFLDRPPVLFPVACWRRMIDVNTIYVMEANKAGLNITKIIRK